MASKRVQDIAKNLKELPKQYVQKESKRPIQTSPPSSPIPVVDLHLLSSSHEDEMKKEMERLRTALQTWGFFQAIGHGISSSLLDEVGQLARDFFNLPMEEKQRYSKIGIGGHEDGMEAYGNDIVYSEDQILNWNDRIYLLVTPEEERKLDRWPENPSTFRQILHEYSTKMKEVGDFLLKAMAKLLDLEENYFVSRFGEKATMFVRFNYYPPCSRPDLVLGLTPHSDGGGITILLQDNAVDGLEVLRDGEWVNVPAIPHALLVNLGDQMEALGHGISSSLLDEVGQLARDFFNLPMKEKQRYSKIGIGGHEDGMEAYGNDIVYSEDQILNWNDRLFLLVTPEEERKLDRWPENPSTFRQILHEYSAKMKEVGDFLLKAMAKLLDLEENYFVSRFGEKAKMYVRFNYYPPCSRPDLVLGLTPHSDGRGITILLQDNAVDGLEVLRDGEWVNVPAIPHALLVNLGDQMEIMSNGIFKSPVHRAVTNSEKERVSVAMFFSPDPQTEISPADELVDTMKSRLYKKVKAEDYIQIFLKNYAQGERTIDWAKV
ncbi:protein SRG1-like isoform X1 [Tasmannia lanceolata]|uniref:protein SRG1-like isoform X1 n=1 Tax=Tasmannia lanceolata TaxID=3420 RepID=UPI004062A744